MLPTFSLGARRQIAFTKKKGKCHRVISSDNIPGIKKKGKRGTREIVDRRLTDSQRVGKKRKKK
jgi:hypothetical protein